MDAGTTRTPSSTTKSSNAKKRGASAPPKLTPTASRPAKRGRATSPALSGSDSDDAPRQSPVDHLKVFARWRGHQVRVGLVQLCPHTAARHAATETLNVFFFSPSTTDSVQDVHSALENVNKCIPGVFSAAVRGQDLVVIMLLWMHM